MERSRKLEQESANSVAAQRKMTSKSRESEAVAAIDESPLMVSQRAKLQSLFGGAAQRQASEEELLQGKFEPAQRMEEEELLQGKFAVAQRAEEEELLQGKFEPAQRMEEEEPLQGKFAVAQRVDEEELLQGKFEAAPSVQRKEQPAAKPNDTGLPDNLKSGIESLSGMSMDNVKVHYNSSQPAQLNALAYAQGTDIHVAPGQEQHLPHEAWHVVQQAQGRVKPTTQMKGTAVNDDAGLEREADVMGAKAVSVGTVQEKRSTESDLRNAGFDARGNATAQLHVDDPRNIKYVRKFVQRWFSGIVDDDYRKWSLINKYTNLIIVNWDDSRVTLDNLSRHLLGESRRLGITPVFVFDEDMVSSDDEEMVDDEVSHQGGIIFGGSEDMDVEDMVGNMSKNEYLQQLDKSGKTKSKPLGNMITNSPSQYMPQGAIMSSDINGGNYDCVLAAFKTVKPGIDFSIFKKKITSTEDGIRSVAEWCGMQQVDRNDVPGILSEGRRVFITAPALYGNGNHAYAAVGIDEGTGKIVAWDPDNEHHNLKLVPVNQIDLAYA